MIDTSKNYKCYNILYVEDEHVIRTNVQLCLNHLFNVVIAKDGQEGFEKFKENNFDLVITDINMPYKDGISMLNDIKKLNPDVPCIITSAFDLHLSNKIKNITYCKCVSKPFNIQDLVSTSLEALKVS